MALYLIFSSEITVWYASNTVFLTFVANLDLATKSASDMFSISFSIVSQQITIYLAWNMIGSPEKKFVNEILAILNFLNGGLRVRVITNSYRDMQENHLQT